MKPRNSISGGYSRKEVGPRIKQVVTYVLPTKIRGASVLQVRIDEDDKCLPPWLAKEEIEGWLDSIGLKDSAFRQIGPPALVARYSQNFLKRAANDDDLRTAAIVGLHHAHWITALKPKSPSVYLDLRRATLPMVLSQTLDMPGVKAMGRWRHIDYYDMSGDVRWYSTTSLSALASMTTRQRLAALGQAQARSVVSHDASSTQLKAA